MDTVSVLVAVFVIFLLVWFTKTKYASNIPGPMGLPIVGYLPFMTKKPYLKLAQLRHKYGPIYRIHLGSREIIILCDFNIIKDAFTRDEIMGRPPDMPFDLSEETIRTEAFLGMPWKEQKRFSLHRLRDLGFGKTRMEEHLKEEIEELLERMNTETSKSTVRISDLLAPSMSNNIASFLFGKRLKYNNPRRKKLDELFSTIGKLNSVLALKMFFPWMGPFIKFFNIGSPKTLEKALEGVKEYVMEEIEEHEKTLDPNNIRDFLDGYLLEIEKRSNEPNTTFKRDVLCDMARGFFGAGSETVRVSVDWLLLLCAAYPEVQKKIHQEIDTVLGTERFPSFQDRFDMPYTEACICEMWRWKPTIPLSFLRYTLKDTELSGYFLPKHTRIMAVPYAVDHDEKLWGKDHDVYKPERFLNPDGKKVVKPEYFVPFSIGKRSCPGKSLAETEVFVYVTAILQRFEFSLPFGKKADLEGFLGIGIQPKRQELCLKLRQ
ncbi:hypothetical protein JTE90_007899 [Oedothorax gibbosus]|uniref:Cytochrome P450 n=1 Tax=Oedothorax gibbosus TaxID=931172 RepID=A0AAV6VHK1_9ARAC|nr:hypothetical protein JTE90_007899 [Oedothorax gibbosus]